MVGFSFENTMAIEVREVGLEVIVKVVGEESLEEIVLKFEEHVRDTGMSLSQTFAFPGSLGLEHVKFLI